MSNQKQFGVWMDNHHATVVGSNDTEGSALVVITHVTGEIVSQNSNEKNANNHEKTIQAKFFKEIASYITNASHVHVTGTGQAQEQFIHYLKDTPQFKNIKTAESTSNKMSEERLLEYIAARL